MHDAASVAKPMTGPPKDASEYPEGRTAGLHQETADVAVTVDILGIALYIPETNRVVCADGSTPTIARFDGQSIIPAHYTFLAFEPGTYQLPGNMKPGMSFDYDLDGDGKDKTYEALLLSGHRVSVENVNTSHGQRLGLDTLARVSTLEPKLELKDGVKDGKAKDVSACLELTNAWCIRGEEHGIHSVNRLKFNGRVEDCPEKLVAEFERGEGTPWIEVSNGVDDFQIVLLGDGPWSIMLGNVPVEELMDRNTLPNGDDVPLLHNEIIYKLYKTAPGQKLNIPTCNHPMVRTADGVCGPPYKP